jgi:hypothetical protein
VDLHAAIEALYATFARYPVGAKVEGCPCCVDAALARALASAPLRAVPDDILQRYAFKAMTTWGSNDDFKHFVPAIWERMTATRSFGVNPQIAYGKLPYTDWDRWPEHERAAIVEATHAWLRHELARGAGSQIADIVECAGVSGIPVAPLIGILEASEGPIAANAIADLLRGGILGWSWWRDDDERLLHTWASERAPEKLEAAFFAYPDHPDAKRWSDAIQFRMI